MRRDPLLGLILAVVAACPAEAGEARYLGTYVWTIDNPDFGGWSGFDTSAEGSVFRAVSDIGKTIGGRLIRDEASVVTGVEAGPIMPLLGDAGEVMKGPTRDAEGVDLSADGSFAVSFEGAKRTARVMTYAGETTKGVILTDGRFMGKLAENKGPEALAFLPDGTAYAILEGQTGPFGDHRVYSGKGKEWSEVFSIPRDGTWSPVGADFGPDGRLYLLERDFWPLLGFRSRVLRMTVTADGLAESEVLFETHVGVHDNLEGIGVWTAPDGSLRMTMISDDNFRRSQRTEIVDYAVAD
jgi:hypothetical protein